MFAANKRLNDFVVRSSRKKVEKLLYNLSAQRVRHGIVEERNWIFDESCFPCHVLIVTLSNGDQAEALR